MTRFSPAVAAVVAACALAAVAAGPSSAQDRRWEDPNLRPISGSPGPATRDLTPNQDEPCCGMHTTFGLHAIYSTESSNRPRELYAGIQPLCANCDEEGLLLRAYASADDYDDVNFFVGAIDGWSHTLLTALDGPLRLDVGPNRYISSIQVCTSGQSDPDRRRIKGIRVWSARLHGATVVRTGEMIEATRTNCSIWHERQICVGNRVAVGFEAHYDPSRTQPFFTGIQLRCARVV